MALTPGPGKMFLIPDDRGKFSPNGMLVIPTMAQDDAFQGTVVAIGAAAWLGTREGEKGLVYDTGDHRTWTPDHQRAPCQVGDVVFYEPERITILPLGWSETDGKVYILPQADVVGLLEAV